MKKILFTIFTITANSFSLFAEEVVTEISKSSAGNDGMSLGIIGTILGAVALSLVCFTFIDLNKKISKVETDKNNDNKLQAKKNNTLKENNKKLEERVDKLESFINTSKVELKSQSNSPSQSFTSHTAPVSCQDISIKSDNYVLDNNNLTQKKNNDRIERQQTSYYEDIKKSEVSQTKEEPMKEINYFVGVPNDLEGFFTKIEEEFIPEETFFMIKTMDGKQGYIDFINRKETIAVASRNLSRWINPVCDIIGNMPDSLTKIITKQPGIVEKTNGGWKIVKKAVVELS